MSSRLCDAFDDDHAHGTNVQDGVAVLHDGSHLAGKHFFEDEYVRTENGWRIAKRVAFGLIPDPA